MAPDAGDTVDETDDESDTEADTDDETGDATTEIPVRGAVPAEPAMLEFDEDDPGPEHEPGYAGR